MKEVLSKTADGIRLNQELKINNDPIVLIPMVVIVLLFFIGIKLEK
jgi:hypothetical protein